MLLIYNQQMISVIQAFIYRPLFTFLYASCGHMHTYRFLTTVLNATEDLFINYLC